MKLQHKKIFVSGVALTVAGILGVGALLQTSISVQASSEMMPGIEKIVKNASSDNEPFRILEIVDNKSEAEIGYYISGQEPYIKLYQYEYQDADKNTSTLTFSSLDDGLSKITDPKTRKEFAENKKYNEDGTEKTVDENGNPVTTEIKDISYAVDGENGPLSFTDYQEQYLTNPGDWKEIKFVNPDGSSRTEEVEIKGEYQQNPDTTGDYTKQEQTYYPIRESTGDKTNEADKFRENIQNFFYSEGDGASAPYYVEFEKVSNSWLNELLKTDEGRELLSEEYNYSDNRFGYYENVYSNLTTELADNPASYPGENPEKPQNLEPILTIASLQEETQFIQGENEFSSDGSETQDSVDTADAFNDVDSFGSGVSNDAAPDAVSSAESDSIDTEAAFSGGEFSDSQQVDDENSVSPATDGQGTADQNQGNIDDITNGTEVNTGTENGTDEGIGTGSENGVDVNSGNSSESGNDANADASADKPQTLKPTSQDTSVGTAANPYVYLGTQTEVYPYYSYTAITDLQAAKKEAEDNAKKQQEAEGKNEIFIPGDQAITVEDGQYYYWQAVGNDMKKSPVTIITGKQPVSYSDLLAHEVGPQLAYDYYYRVSGVYFCCKMQVDNADDTDPKNYDYYGWYYASHPQGEEIYLPETGSNATYYVSDAEYKLTPGTGDYDFIPGDGEGTKTYKVEIDHMYYTGGYTNHDWFKRYVFHLDSDADETKDDFKNFRMEVVTVTKEEFAERFANGASVSETADGEASAQFTDSEFTDSSAEMFSDTYTDGEQDVNGDIEITDGETSEVESMVSEAGVELVSIEKEINAESETDVEPEINTETTMEDVSKGLAENQATESNENTALEEQVQDFQDGEEESNASEDISELTAPEAEFTDSAENQETIFSAGETQNSDSESSVLSDYDLIYLNSTLASDEAEIIASSSIPCIVNAKKAATDTEFAEKYAGFTNTDEDNHYVKDYIYFFRNTLEADLNHEGDLVNLKFDYNFNTDSDISDGSTSIAGFEEILEYIESENQYRKLGSTEVTDGTAPSLLTTEISQARAIEYIINTKLKRSTTYKKKINVLQISADKNCEQITDQNVYDWLDQNTETSEQQDVKIGKIEACHSDTQHQQIPENIYEDDKKDNLDKIWHSVWKESNPNTGWDGTDREQDGNHNGKGHCLTITLQKVSNVSGLIYTSVGGRNGVLLSGEVEFKDKNGRKITFENSDGETTDTLIVKTGLDYNNYWKKTVNLPFGQTIHDVKTITLYFKETLSQNTGNENRFASCARLSVFYTPEVDWVKIEGIQACHSHKTINADGTVNESSSDLPGNMLDSNASTVWHSPWQQNENGPDAASWDGRKEISATNQRGHNITITLKSPSTVNGFMYKPRQDSYSNGVLTSGVAEFRDENGNLIDTANVTTGLTGSNYKRTVNVMFGKTVSNVKTITLYFTKTLPSGTEGGMASCAELRVFYMEGKPAVSVTSVTAAEFVGHIDDFAAEYDMIYISDEKKKNSEKFLTGEGDLRYSHVGASVAASSGAIVSKPGDDTDGNSELFKLLGQLDNEFDNSYSGEGQYTKRFAPVSTFSKTGGGYFRGSGNDITKQQCEKLLDFVKSGYPVILASGLVNANRMVNTSEVDTASYYYEFMSKALKYDNVVTKAELENDTKDIKFFANLAKPVINFEEKPKEPQRANVTDDSEKYGNISGELKFVFSIENDSDAIPAVTTYDCDLYLDLNFDGNMSSKEAQDKYIEIRDAVNNVLTQKKSEDGSMHYELEAGKKYTLTRKIPKDYYKLITWKIQISSNRNSYIHTSETGYAKQNRTTEKQTINVLQVVPDKYSTWPLNKNDNNHNNDLFWKKIEDDVKDFNINIAVKTVTDVNNCTQENWKKLLSDKQMLILGFGDVYTDISNENKQVDEILDFIRSGKSIIFAHDTTSYVNYNYAEVYPDIVSTTYGERKDKIAQVYYDSFLRHSYKANNPTWGLSLNQVLRSIVGMDRYGITSDYKILTDNGGTTIGSILKQGKELHDGSSEVSFKTLMEVVGDIAYQTNGDRTSSYAQTQSYTNNLLNEEKMGTGNTIVEYVTKINDGAITQYPYEIGDTIKVAKTHGQYYQLALEQDYDTNNRSDGETDIVVWYCLGGNDGTTLYDSSPNDARNNYYLYSKGNVIYTGAGHSNITSDNEEEINLFINAIVAAANVAAAAPEVTFVKSLSPAAEVENTRYYMTDQENWTKNEQNVVNSDMDFFVNVKDYNMVSLDLTQGDLDNQEMTLDFYIQDQNGSETIDAGDGEVKVTRLNDLIKALKIYGKADQSVAQGADGSFHFTENNAYGFNLEGMERYLRDTEGSRNGYYENCKIYVKVSSTVSLYGNTTKKESWSSINLKQRQLFDLD